MDRLVGVWRLVSFRERRDGGLVDVFGRDPQGCITYAVEGRMSALLADPRRPKLKGEWSAIPDAAKAANYDGLVAYAGAYSLEGDRVIHHVDICWIPNWEGRDLVRMFSFDGPDRLILRTVDNPRRPQPPQEVVWSRVKP